MSDPRGTVGVRRPLALALLCAAFFLGVLDSTSLFAALPRIGDDLGLDPAALVWVVTVSGVVVAGFMLPFGRMADVFGRRRTFIAAVAVFGLASLVCGLATTGGVLIAARAVMGLGAAALTPAALALLLVMYPEGPERNRALGIWGGLGGLGATVGLLLGGLVTATAGWPWVFLVNVPVCAAVVVLAPRLLAESRRGERRPFDLPGGLLVSATLVLLTAGLLELSRAGWAAQTWALLVGASAFAAVLGVVERRSDDPILPARLLRARGVVIGNVVVLTGGIAVDGLLALTTVYLQRTLGLSAMVFGLALAAMTVSSIVAVAVGQSLVSRAGPRPVAVVGLAMLGVSCASFTLLPADGSALPLLVGGLLVFGTGMGGAFVAGQIAAVTGVHDDDAGAASGLEETSFTIGGTLGIAIVTSVAVAFSTGAAAAIGRGSGDASTGQLAGLHAAFAVLAAIAFIGAAAALAYPGRAALGARQSGTVD
ncbi:drug resistance transporter, EmrB/QacA subfamily [Agromyces sp. CF514]|uniref:MFS transporter n=1 Tax=Agromyces sp. CF514 TaxID=1881031 RepID=UPI0008E8723C|nr:MFS transporter [Agromyces sp. CF514]SFR77585.1 drug resistance transporter, EmrB/QacA subfamily [Agromyces sp. CF514]